MIGITQSPYLPAANYDMETMTRIEQSRHCLGRQTGFTAIELAIVITLVAILSSIIVPGMGDVFARSALTTGQQDLMQALRKAKVVARNENTSVTVTLTAKNPRITLLSANGRFVQNIDLPASIAPLQSDSYRFNSMGVLNKIGTITLTSLQDATQTRQVSIRTLFGQLEAL